LATFYLCIPVGYAAGYILGGVIAPALGWRAPFLLEAAAMLPFAVFCAVGPALDLRGKQHHTGSCQDLHAFACPCMHMTACKTRRAILGFWLAAFQLVSCSANSACGQQNLPYTCTTWLLQLRPCDRQPGDNCGLVTITDHIGPVDLGQPAQRCSYLCHCMSAGL